MYILLTGYPPFNGHTDTEIMNKVKIGKYDIDGADYEHISPDAKRLLSKLLAKDPKNRLSA